jgi:hypothetical protein
MPEGPRGPSGFFLARAFSRPCVPPCTPAGAPAEGSAAIPAGGSAANRPYARTPSLSHGTAVTPNAAGSAGPPATSAGEPWARSRVGRSRPSTATSSQKRRARSMSCSTATTVVPRSATRRRTSDISSCAALTSRYVVGSSRRRTPASCASAIAMNARCRSPPESLRALRCASAWSPMSERASSTARSSFSPR